jgi:hypothetical protein
MPNMQGAVKTSMPYWVDICGYLYQDTDEAGVRRTNLLIENHPQYEAGNRLQGKLPGLIQNPNITDILTYAYA